eukprot:g3401.t1
MPSKSEGYAIHAKKQRNNFDVLGFFMIFCSRLASFCLPHSKDSVQLDEWTGRSWFLLYNSLMAGSLKEAWILLLDASRGLQAVSSPLPAAELRRCAL